MARVPQITSRDMLPEAARHVADQVHEVFGRIRGPFSILLYSPEMAEKLLPMVPFNREHSVIPGALKSVGILAAVREKNSPYVWSAQAGAGRVNGLREEAIDLLRARAPVDAFPEDERDVVIYGRHLANETRVPQAVFDKLHDRYGTQWLVEMTTFMGFYNALCAVTNAFEVGTPEDGDALPGTDGTF